MLKVRCCSWLIVFLLLAVGPTKHGYSALQDELGVRGKRLEADYAKRMEALRSELIDVLPAGEEFSSTVVQEMLADDALDDKLVRFVVLHEATPRGLAEFADAGDQQQALVERLLSDGELMKQMLVADGARREKQGRQLGPARYGRAMQIYSQILSRSVKSKQGVLQRLALAISLEHAVPIAQTNAKSNVGGADFVDPVQRYAHYERAYLAGELDAAFEQLSTWEMRMVVDGDEPDEILAWGREMLRNYRPDHVLNADYGWRYVSIVRSDVKYGSGDVKYDRPELQKYQNILMNGGVCGRRAFIGRFMLRAFGVPTIARPSRGHGALAHWTPAGWVVNLGGDWGCGWTNTLYDKDLNFLASTQARSDSAAFLRVKRAQWAGDVMGETRTYGASTGSEGFWNRVAAEVQREIIESSNAVPLGALGKDLAEASESTVREKIMASPVTDADRQVAVGENGTITIPAAAYSSPTGNTSDVIAMKSFAGGLQVFLPRFFPQGTTIMRGGTWKGEADACTSGKRMLSGGYGKYENWGMRVALTPATSDVDRELAIELGNGVSLELVYIEPGEFVMGGESETDGRFQCVEVPKHKVKITQGFYLGKFEVTQAQYEAVVGNNPSRSTRDPNCPVDNVGEQDAIEFCNKVAEQTGVGLRLPTEAEWEFASRAGQNTKWFFGDDPMQIGEFAWFKGNAGGKSHPVGQKRPNQWGLYDIYGNVCERISDKYARGYYANSPAADPTGPSPGTKSKIEYQLNVPVAGEYQLRALVVTANYDQRLKLNVNSSGEDLEIQMPFTKGSWRESDPVIVSLEAGENTLRFWRDNPPQYGLAIKEFILTPVK